MGKKEINSNDNESISGKFSYENLTRIIHEKARLGIITSLLGNKEGLCFNDLKSLCRLSDGNLSRHMQALEKFGFVEVIKGYEGRKPKTVYKLTVLGENEFLKYLADLEKVIYNAHKAMKKSEIINLNELKPEQI